MATYIIHNKKGIVKVEAETASAALDIYVTGTLCAKKAFGLTVSFYGTVKSYLTGASTEVKAKLINGCCTTSAYKITAISSVSDYTEINA